MELELFSVISSTTRGVVGPKGMPEPVVKKLQHVLKRAMEHPDHISKMEDAGFAVKVMVGEEYARYYRDLHAKAARYVEWARSRVHR